MRNWNVCPEPITILVMHASRLPMRNWNHPWQGSLRYFILLPDYLWGIETVPSLHRSSRLFLSLPDYLWGIETLAARDDLFRSSHFQASRLPMRNWNAHWASNLLLNVIPCFQTTYEELKRSPHWVICRSCGLPDYLWGIETTSFLIVFPLSLQASRLPMRNWNWTTGPETIRAEICFQTTYEELKLSSTSSS